MIEFRTNGMDEINRKLDALAGRMKGDVIIAGCAAAALEFYVEAKLRAPVQSGTLRDAIYRVYSKDNSSDGRAVYHVSVNRSKAPHFHLVEYGTSRAAAHPFMRPAYDAAKGAAVKAAQQRMLDKMKELEK